MAVAREGGQQHGGTWVVRSQEMPVIKGGSGTGGELFAKAALQAKNLSATSHGR